MTETKLISDSELPELELWLPDIKKYAKKNLVRLLKSAGYKFNRSDFSFRKKHGKHFEEFSFNFFNRFPLNYRVNFLLQIWNNDIKTIKANFPYQSKIENYKLRSLVLFMTEFQEPGDSLHEDQGPIKDYVLVTNTDLFNAIDAMHRMLQDRAIPLGRQLSSLDGLDRFFATHPGWAVNTLNMNNISTELIAARLNQKRNLEEVFSQINRAIDLKIEQKEMSSDIKEMVALYHDYVKK
jgi:hypothetical protein